MTSTPRRLAGRAAARVRRLLNTPRRIAGAAVAAAAVIGLAVWLASWLTYRADHVQSQDARIQARIITVSSRYAGWVTKFPLIQGDRPHKGAVITRIYGKDARLHLASARAKRDALRSRLASTRAQLAQARKQTAADLDAARQSLAAAKAALKGRESRLSFAQSDAKEGRTLVKKSVITRREEHKRETAFKRARAAVTEARAQLHRARAGVARARAGRGRVSVLAARVKSMAARASAATAALHKAKLAVTDRVIKSPIDGVVDKTFVVKGDYVTPGQPLLMMHDPRHVWVEANVKETEVASVAKGDPVSIHVDAYPGRTFHGKVRRVGNAATNEFALLPNPNPSGNFVKITQRIPVRITLEQTRHDSLSPGMNVEVSIDASSG